MATMEEFLLKFKTQGVESINAASNSIKGLSTQVSSMGGNLGPAGDLLGGMIGKLGPIGAAAGAAGLAFAALGLKAISLADALGDISDATGINSGALNNLKNSIVMAGGKADDFSTLASKLNQNLGDAAVGGEKAQQAFRKLGVYVTDANGAVRNTGDVLRDAISRLAAIEDPASRASMAVDLFGKSAAKLDFTKLDASNDFAKDEQIAQLSKYQDALDAIGNSVSNSLITNFGKLAIAIQSAQATAAKAEADANKKGFTTGNAWEQNATMQVGGMNPFGLGGAPAGKRKFTPEEQKAYDLGQKQIEQQKEYARLEQANRSYQSRAPSEGAGGFGATPEATLKAVAESEKRVAQSRIDNNKFASLKVEEIKLSSALKGANALMAIDINAASAVKNIQIQTNADIAKATADIQNQDKLSQEQKNKEIASKSVEIQGKAALDIQKINDKAAADIVSYKSTQNAKIFAEEDGQRQAAIDAITAQQKGFDDAAKSAYELTNQLQLSRTVDEDRYALQLDLINASDIEKQKYTALFDLEQKRQDQIRALGNIANLTNDERVAGEKRINDEMAKSRGLIGQQAEDQIARQASFALGWEEAFKKYEQAANDTNSQAKGYFDTFSRGFEDTFVNMVKTGDISFKALTSGFRDVANSMIADFIRIQAQKALLAMLPGGGVFSAISSMFGMANGGPVQGNVPIMVGERGPEMFIPKGPGTIVPNGAMNAAASGEAMQTIVNYNIQAVDASSFRSLVARDPSFIYAVTEQGRRSQPTRRLG